MLWFDPSFRKAKRETAEKQADLGV